MTTIWMLLIIFSADMPPVVQIDGYQSEKECEEAAAKLLKPIVADGWGRYKGAYCIPHTLTKGTLNAD